MSDCGGSGQPPVYLVLVLNLNLVHVWAQVLLTKRRRKALRLCPGCVSSGIGEALQNTGGNHYQLAKYHGEARSTPALSTWSHASSSRSEAGFVIVGPDLVWKRYSVRQNPNNLGKIRRNQHVYILQNDSNSR
jgi:hypothetical protein